eukprot:jgi/Orpsp1_1/1176969/evm.model.c7180000059659.1
MSSDIHIEKDFKNIDNDNRKLKSPKFSSKNLDFFSNDEFSTPPRTKKESFKIEPSAPKKKSGKNFFNSIVEKRKKKDLFNNNSNNFNNNNNNNNNNYDDYSLPSSPTIDIQSNKHKK